MTRTIELRGVTDVSAELDRAIDQIARRFPAVPRAEVDRLVHETYDQLSRTATVRAHLLVITSAIVMNRFRTEAR